MGISPLHETLSYGMGKAMTDGIKITTTHTISVPLFPPQPPEANAYGKPTVQTIYLSDEMAKQLIRELNKVLKEF